MEPKADGGPDTRTPAVRRAVEFGIDLTLLIENLRRTPTERVRRAQRSLASVVAVQAQAAAARAHRRP